MPNTIFLLSTAAPKIKVGEDASAKQRAAKKKVSLEFFFFFLWVCQNMKPKHSKVRRKASIVTEEDESRGGEKDEQQASCIGREREMFKILK